MAKIKNLNLERIESILKEHKEELKEKYQVKEIGIFGSYVTGKQRKRSDVDILVEFENPIDFFVYLDLKDEVEQLLDIKVDLVMKRALKPKIGERILEETIYV